MKTNVKSTAMQNIAKLPSKCYGVLLMDKSIISIHAGESGYYPTKHIDKNKFIHDGMLLHDVKSVEELVDIMNESIGVSKAERAAMEWGSQFGWEHGLSDCSRYNEHGLPIC